MKHKLLAISCCLLAVSCLLLAVSCPVQAEVFGDQNQESTGSVLENHQVGLVATPSLSGTVDSITCWHVCNAAHKTRYALYEWHGPTGNVPIDSTAEFTLSPDTGWHSQVTLLGGTVSAGTKYLIVAWSEAGVGYNNMVYANTGDTASDYSKTYTGNGWDSPASASPGAWGPMSIYCTYSEAAKEVPKSKGIIKEDNERGIIK